MSRRLLLDSSPGETRGVVLLDGQPERFLIERPGLERGPRLGARYVARVTELSGDRRLAFLDLGQDGPAVAAAGKDPVMAVGAVLDVEIVAEARSGKAAAVRRLGQGAGKARLLQAAPALETRLTGFASGAPLETGVEAREAADEAEDQALARLHDLGQGLSLSVEPTRALTAIDVDWAAPGGIAAKAAFQANLRAIRHAVRLLRLKALGGAAVIDLLGFPGPGDALQAQAREALAPDGPGTTVLPVSRLGLLQLARPHGGRPVHELLLAVDGRLSARSVAQRLARAMEREGRADPGARIVGVCAGEVASELSPLSDLMGPRFQVAAELGWDRLKTDILRS